MYLQIPVLASFRADLSKSVNLQVNAGPHFALGLGGKYKEEWNETYEGVTESGSDDIPFFGKSKKKNSAPSVSTSDFRSEQA